MIARRLYALHAALTLLLCSCGHNATVKTMVAGAEFANSARDLATKFSIDYQESIVADCERVGNTPEAKAIARQKIADFRVKRAKADFAVTALQALVVSGKPLLELVGQGTKADGDIAAYLKELTDFILAVRQSLRELGVTAP